MQTKADKTFWGGMFLALFLKYLLFGFQYFPALDDYIQYGSYPLYPSIVQDVFLRIGTISTRPLASLLDPLLWGKLWNWMPAALILITLLHFGSFLLLDKTFRLNRICVSPLLFILFLLFPAMSEATYWISASSRLVVGMFFAVLAVYLLSRYILQRKCWWLLALSALSLLVSFGFYEQIAVFGFFAYLLVLFYHRRLLPWKRLCLIPAGCAAALGLYYVLASGIGQAGSRASGFALRHLTANILPFIRQLYETWIVQGGKITLFGGYNGFLSLLGASVPLVLLFIALTAVSAAQIDNRELTADAPIPWTMAIGGAILFLAPYAPNLLVEEVWLTNRSMFPSIIGLGLMLEPLFQRLFRKSVLRTVCLMALVFLFIFANLNEYKTYRDAWAYDNQIVSAIGDQLEPAVLNGEKKAMIICTAPDHIDQTAFYKDHVKSVTYADWSLTGALRAYRRNLNIRQVELVTDPLCLDFSQLENKQIFCIHVDGTVSVYSGPASIY